MRDSASQNSQPGEKSMSPIETTRSSGVGCTGLKRARSATRPQNRARVARASGRPAAGQAVGEGDAVHGAGAGAADAGDLEPAVLEQPVEHAPGEGAVRAAALQRQVDPLGAAAADFAMQSSLLAAAPPVPDQARPVGSWQAAASIPVRAAGHCQPARRRASLARAERRPALAPAHHTGSN